MVGKHENLKKNITFIFEWTQNNDRNIFRWEVGWAMGYRIIKDTG